MVESRDEFIVRRTAEGKTTEAIAKELFVGIKTVERIRKRLGLKTKTGRKAHRKPIPMNEVWITPDWDLLPDA